MSRSLELLLRVASRALPAVHRARWREEALAVLLDTSGPRRWRYAVDTVVKAPVLAWHLRRAGSGRRSTDRGAALAGAGLLAIPVLVLGAVAMPPLVGEDTAELVFLLAPAGMLPVVALRSWRSARRRGGGPLRLAAAVVVTVFAGTGPVAAGALSVATGLSWIAVPGSLVPGLWLAGVGGLALVRRVGPAALAVIAAVAGAGLTGILLSLQLTIVGAPHAMTLPVSALALLAFVPSFTVWTVWSGTRLLRGHAELLTTPSPPA
jgi:hypothetical protein